MRKGLLFLLILAMICCAAWAHAEQEPEWVYSNNQGGVGLYNGPGGDVTVPEVLEDHVVRAVGDALFSRNDSIVSVRVPASVLSLGSGSLNSCANLERVTLSEGLQSIEYNNFVSLPKLVELTIPSTVAIIDYSVSWCDQLKTVTFLGECPVFCNPDFCFSVLPDDLTVYVPDDQLEAYRAALINLNPDQVQPSGQNAIPHDYTPAREEMEFDAANGTITRYTGESLRVDLPAEIDGVPVTAIGMYAFRNSNVAVVNIPEGVTEIASMAFDSCSDLQVVRMPNSLKKIGSNAFDGIEGNMILWGQGLEEIGDGAFRYVDIGAELDLPDSLRVIGSDAFYRASLRNVHIGSAIERIGSGAFADTNLNYLQLDVYAMIDVAEDAFEDTRLEDIDLPWDSDLENQRAWQALIDAQVEGCKVWINNPTDCDLPESGSCTYAEYPDGTLCVTAYTGARENLVLFHTMDSVQVTGIGDGAFRGNQTIKKYRVTHNDTFTTIGAEAFAGSAVEVVDLYYTTETIGAGAFRDCLGLTEITLPASLTSVGSGAFAGCANLAKVTILCDPAIIPSDAFDGTAYAAGQMAPAVEMPFAANDESDFTFDASTGTITAYVGSGVDVVIPRQISGVDVKAIAYDAFECARDYTDSEVASNRTTWLPLRSVVIPDTVETIADSAFSYCQQLELVICYAPLESTGRGTFLLCRSLKDVIFVNGVQEIDNYAFESTAALERVYWGDHLRRIGQNAFNRTGLKKIVIDAEIVDEGAFNHSALEAVILTDRVREIQGSAFYACENLTYFACQFVEADRFQNGAPTAGIPQTGVTTLFPAATTEDQLRALNNKLNFWNGGHLGNGNTITLSDVEAELVALPDVEALFAAVASQPVPDVGQPAPEAPVELPAPIADLSTVLGEWQLSAMAEGGAEYDVAMFGFEMTLTLNADGSGQANNSGEVMPTNWKQDDQGVLWIIDRGEEAPAGLDASGRFVMYTDGTQLIFVRGGEAPANQGGQSAAAADLSSLLGNWRLSALAEDGTEYDASMFGLDMTLTLYADGSGQVNNGGEIQPTAWRQDDQGVFYIVDHGEEAPANVDESGRLVMFAGGTMFIFVRDGETPAPAPEPEPAPQSGDLPAPIADLSTVLGDWQLSAMVQEGTEYDAALFGLEMTLTLNADGSGQANNDGEVMPTNWKQDDQGVLWIIDRGEEAPAGLDASGRFVMYTDGTQLIFVRAETPAPAPEPEPAPQSGDLPAPIDDLSAVLGDWQLSAMVQEGTEYDAAPFGLDMTLTLNADGSGQANSNGEITPTNWEQDAQGVLWIIDPSGRAPAGLDDGGRLIMDTGDGQLVFERMDEAPAPTPADDPEDTFVPVRAEQYMPMVGVWYGVWVDAGGGQFNPIKDKNYEMILTVYADGTATLSDDDRDPQLMSYNGYVMFGGQPLELVEDGRFLHLGSTGSGSMYFCQDRNAEIPEQYRHGMQDYYNSMTPATPEPGPAPTVEDIPGDLQMDVKYLATSYSTMGISYDAAILGAEYSVTLHADGTCEFVLGGFAVQGVAWTLDGDTIHLAYAAGYDCAMNGGALELDFSGVMLLHMVPQV